MNNTLYKFESYLSKIKYVFILPKEEERKKTVSLFFKDNLVTRWIINVYLQNVSTLSLRILYLNKAFIYTSTHNQFKCNTQQTHLKVVIIIVFSLLQLNATYHLFIYKQFVYYIVNVTLHF